MSEWSVAAPSPTPTASIPQRPLRAIGVVVPAHNEERDIHACLDAIAIAAAALTPDVSVRVVIVLDDCSDYTADIVARTGRRWQTELRRPQIHTIKTGDRNVGAARAAGCREVLRCFPLVPRDRVWLASTDADSTVPAHWLAHQAAIHHTGTVAWVGTVDLATPHNLGPADLRRYRNTYTTWDSPTHPHVHASNLGIRSDIYQQVGGFRPIRTGEDHDLVARLDPSRHKITRGLEAPVATSTRPQGRAPRGFADYLHHLIASPDV